MERNDNLTICVGRQLGSGGRTIAKMLAEQLNCRFFDFTLLIGSSKIDLNDILSTVCGSGILHRDRDGKVLVVFSVPRKLFATLETGTLKFPFEVGIAKTISEWENDIVLIPGIIGFSSCLVMTISKIDALFIIDIMFRNRRLCSVRKMACSKLRRNAVQRKIKGARFKFALRTCLLKKSRSEN